MSAAQSVAENTVALGQVHERRVLCLVLSNLPCELVMPRLKLKARIKAPPLAVVMTDQLRTLIPQDTLDAVNETARRAGVAVGQSIAEAHAQLAQLQVRSLSAAEMQLALGKIAESVLQFGVTVALHAPDTVCLEITGVAHLFDGEESLATQVAARVRGMGHSVRIAVANGPVVAQALARWANYAPRDQGVRCFATRSVPKELAALPVAALPLQEEEEVAWLIRCGLYSVGDLKRLPAASLSARLGGSAVVVGDFIRGHDATPLVPHQPAPQLCEEFEAEEGMKGVEPLLFVLKGLCARLSARLQGRAEAVRELRLTLLLDKSIAALQGAPATTSCEIFLPAAIFKAEELERIVATRSKRLSLDAPIITVRLQADDISEAPALQLDLSRVLPGAGGRRNQGAEELPLLLAEIVADIGRSRVGVLREISSHIPEGKSVLAEPVLKSPRKGAEKTLPRGQHLNGRGGDGQARLQVAEQRSFSDLLQEKKNVQAVEQESPRHKLQPTRLYPKPVPLTVKLEQGATVVIGGTLFTIEKAEFERRLSEIEWWSVSAISRDYWRLWLHSPSGSCAALAFVERKTGKRFLQALYD